RDWSSDVCSSDLALLDELGNTDIEVDLDTSLLDATGHTQVLSDDFSVDTTGDAGAPLKDDEKTMLAPALDSDAETMLASLGDLDDEEDYAATAALSGKDIRSEEHT